MKATLVPAGCGVVRCHACEAGARSNNRSLASLNAREKVDTEIIQDCSQATLRAVIRGRIDPASVGCSDGWPGDDGLVEVGDDKPLRINKKKSFAKGRAHLNGIAAFWSFTKRRLARFNGVKVNFPLHLKEGEWRDDQPASSLAKDLLTLSKNPVEVLV